MYLYCAVLLRSCVLVLCQDRSWIEVNSFVKLVCLFQQPIVWDVFKKSTFKTADWKYYQEFRNYYYKQVVSKDTLLYTDTHAMF